MNELFNKYPGVIRCSDEEIHEEFLKIYQHHEYIEEWLDKLTFKLDLKNDEEARQLRYQGNTLYTSNARKASILLLSAVKTHVEEQSLDEELPSLTGGFNSKLPGASSTIKLNYDKARGRHVIANEDIRVGDVLFVEKPFIFAPVFVNETMEMLTTKCYNCLKTVFSSIPCKYCTKIIYCDEHCRGECWEKFHKWECFGMQCNLWYHIGIGFPAFRAVVKGMVSEDNMYSYFNQLVSNLSKMENVLPLIISAGVIVCYLKKHTTFFNWISKHKMYSEYTQMNLVRLIGGTITKHIAQLQCNSSLIEHVSKQELDEGGSIACAIYPSVSMMNHSCSSNVQICYMREVAVTRASENIAKGDEICNCYGIDYRFSDRQSRQEHCRQYYYFECCCRICKFSELEIV
ncbi:hypothetical protein FQR65_LT07929 [Abscondita terminalis]|nr:hypothetical protein FQR65_LT07929 [Abscondita terminalis]